VVAPVAPDTRKEVALVVVHRREEEASSCCFVADSLAAAVVQLPVVVVAAIAAPSLLRLLRPSSPLRPVLPFQLLPSLELLLFCGPLSLACGLLQLLPLLRLAVPSSCALAPFRPHVRFVLAWLALLRPALTLAACSELLRGVLPHVPRWLLPFSAQSLPRPPRYVNSSC